MVYKIRVVDVPGLKWDWETPSMMIPSPAKGMWERTVRADPFPCYSHDIKLVRKVAKDIALAFPIHAPCVIAVFHYEPTERTNGNCTIESDWNKKKKSKNYWGGSIGLYGKRIPPHPAMTRYLTSHEYGHAVAKRVAQDYYYSTDHSDYEIDNMYKEYRELRPASERAPIPKFYGGGTWHHSTSEIFANDFRILVTGVETEFWPHQGFSYPTDAKKVVQFWKKVVKENNK